MVIISKVFIHVFQVYLFQVFLFIEVQKEKFDSVPGTSWETTPLEIAKEISNSLAKQACVAKVQYGADYKTNVVDADGEAEEDDEDLMPYHLGYTKEVKDTAVLWDLTRPLQGSCKIWLFKFDSAEGKDTFWHSSAHVLGEALENEFGVHLTIGPPLSTGFYYDSFMGEKKFLDSDYSAIEAEMKKIASADQPFERLELTKAEALELFKDNPFKVQLITNKVPEGSLTSCYRVGPLIDLCRGPHLPTTARVKAAAVMKHSAAYWLGKAELDSLQRVYAVTFPDDKQMKAHKKALEAAAKNDHRKIGLQQDLFFFNPQLAAGHAFWEDAGLRVASRISEFVRREYKIRGFIEVKHPLMFQKDLFRMSGHYYHYMDDMFKFDVEGDAWYLKPMNCPGHCLAFAHKPRTHRDLPIRMASFDVLHRNELSGALTGLTRVRNFQQDDAHIFCRFDQLKSEVLGALDFVKYAYNDILDLGLSFKLSTRPKKALGDREMWDKAEIALKEALEEIKADWEFNIGDGAFYGPKIDILVRDCMGRQHQCATIQCDFQLPLRFNLQYKAKESEVDALADKVADASVDDKKGKKDKKQNGTEGEEAEAGAATDKNEKKDKDYDPYAPGNFVPKPCKTGYERPVIVHRAVMGSLERMMAVLTEHFGGKWPFWMSPRQCMVVPVAGAFDEYAQWVQQQISQFGFHADADLSSKTLNKKVREAQVAQYNYICVVGEKEQDVMGVMLRKRDAEKPLGMKSVSELIDMFKADDVPSSKPLNCFTPFQGKDYCPVAGKETEDTGLKVNEEN